MTGGFQCGHLQLDRISVRSCFVLPCFNDFHSRSASKPVTVPGSLLLQLFTNLEAFL